MILQCFADHGIQIREKDILFSGDTYFSCGQGIKWNGYTKGDLTIAGRIILHSEIKTGLKESSVFESVVKNYMEQGSEGIKNLNGDFSFVIWDDVKKEVVVARDHIGHYPLYYINDSEKLIIASFLPWLLCFKNQKEINHEWVTTILNHGVSPLH